MNKLFKIVGLASVLALAALPAVAGTTLKLAHAAPESHSMHVMSEFFKAQVEARTNGNIKVNLFPNGQLGTDSQMIDGVRSGIVDLEISGLNNFTGLIPEAAAFTLPFMFPTRETAYKVLDGEVGQSVFTTMEKSGLKGLGYPENGYRNMSNNRGPIKTPADLVGVRMRVNNSQALNDMFNLLQANPQQIPVAELYTALETGVVDAQDHPIAVVLSFKFYEAQKYLSMTQHAYSPLVLVMNLKKFNGLSAEEQKIITEVAAEAIAQQRANNIAGEKDMIKELEGHGMVVNQDVDGAAFQKAVKPVWSKFIESNGDVLVNAILEASK